MTTATTKRNGPAWVDLATKDAAGARDFYAKLFGWEIEVNADPQYGGYAIAKADGTQAAGIGPTQSPDQPSVWSFYIETDDAEAAGRRAEEAGGTVVMPAFDVGDVGRMAVFQDPCGAFIAVWQAAGMEREFQRNVPNAFGWAELNARGIDKAIPFYQAVFGWTPKTSPTGAGGPDYTEFISDGESIAGGQEMSPMAPAEMPSYWMVYFDVDDVDAAYRKALDAGASEMLSPQDFPGGRFAIISYPQGAMFGRLKSA
jgi:predicted enzyme related to lactoylglutathione lyase